MGTPCRGWLCRFQSSDRLNGAPGGWVSPSVPCEPPDAEKPRFGEDLTWPPSKCTISILRGDCRALLVALGDLPGPFCASQGQQQAANGLSLGTATPKVPQGVPAGRGGSGTLGHAASSSESSRTKPESNAAPPRPAPPPGKLFPPVPTAGSGRRWLGCQQNERLGEMPRPRHGRCPSTGLKPVQLHSQFWRRRSNVLGNATAHSQSPHPHPSSARPEQLSQRCNALDFQRGLGSGAVQ